MELAKEKKSAFLVTFILFEGNVFNICVLFLCMAHWINFKNTYDFPYQKTLLHTLFCFFWNALKTFNVSLCKKSYVLMLEYLFSSTSVEDFLLNFLALLAFFTSELKKIWKVNKIWNINIQNRKLSFIKHFSLMAFYHIL